MYVVVLFALLLLSVELATIQRIERSEKRTWYLGMNLNPSDGHIMDYTTGWAEDLFIGTYKDALKKDYLNRVVWNLPVNYIALVRHQDREVDAVKVFRFKRGGLSMLNRFQDMNPGRQIVTEGGPIQESVSKNARNMEDDPVFSVDGDLAFNWAYSNNGARIALFDGNLSPVDTNDDNTHGLGNHFLCDPLTGENSDPQWAHEISNIQNCPYPSCLRVQMQGTDHGSGPHLISGPVYGNYAIYVSTDATSFPLPGHHLDTEIVVELPKGAADEL